jgi:hypothetical protein
MLSLFQNQKKARYYNFPADTKIIYGIREMTASVSET